MREKPFGANADLSTEDQEPTAPEMFLDRTSDAKSIGDLRGRIIRVPLQGKEPALLRLVNQS